MNLGSRIVQAYLREASAQAMKLLDYMQRVPEDKLRDLIPDFKHDLPFSTSTADLAYRIYKLAVQRGYLDDLQKALVRLKPSDISKINEAFTILQGPQPSRDPVRIQRPLSQERVKRITSFVLGIFPEGKDLETFLFRFLDVPRTLRFPNLMSRAFARWLQENPGQVDPLEKALRMRYPQLQSEIARAFA